MLTGIVRQKNLQTEARFLCAFNHISSPPPYPLENWDEAHPFGSPEVESGSPINLPLRVSNEGLLRPRVARAQEIIWLHPSPSSSIARVVRGNQEGLESFLIARSTNLSNNPTSHQFHSCRLTTLALTHTAASCLHLTFHYLLPPYPSRLTPYVLRCRTKLKIDTAECTELYV